MSPTWTPPSPWSAPGRCSTSPEWRPRSGRWSRTTPSSNDRRDPTGRRVTTTDDLLARTLRHEAGPLVTRLSRRFGDFDLAEEAVQGAVVEALTSWRRHGPPDRP